VAPPIPVPVVAAAVVAPPIPPRVPATGAVAPPPIPGGADAAMRPLFGSKPAAAERPAPSKSKPLPSRAPVEPSAKSRVIQSVVAHPEAAGGWESGRRAFNSKAAPAGGAERGALARIQAVMAVAYWVATSDDDDEMDDDEYGAIVATFSELLGEDVDEAALESTILAWDEAIEADEEAFLAEAAAAIGAGPMRRQALEIATVVAAADDDLSDTEEEALGELAAALGYADRESERIIEGALESLEE
jgi:tellurite resistance protein